MRLRGMSIRTSAHNHNVRMCGSEWGKAMTKKNARRGWGSEIKSPSEQGKQIKCLTAHDGWVWMPTFDSLPAAVRNRLSESRFNMCAACMQIEARKRSGKPSVKIYIETIEAIEKEMESTGEK
jgi:hypothetical protein